MSLDLLSLLSLLGIFSLLLDIKTVLFSTLLFSKFILIFGVLLGVLFLNLLVLGSLLLISLLLFGLIFLLGGLLLLFSFLSFLLLLVSSFLGSLLGSLGLLLLGRSRAARLCGSSGSLGLSSCLDSLSGILLLGFALGGGLGNLRFLGLGAGLVISSLTFSNLDLLIFLNLLGFGISLLLGDGALSLVFSFLAFGLDSVLFFLDLLLHLLDGLFGDSVLLSLFGGLVSDLLLVHVSCSLLLHAASNSLHGLDIGTSDFHGHIELGRLSRRHGWVHLVQHHIIHHWVHHHWVVQGHRLLNAKKGR